MLDRLEAGAATASRWLAVAGIVAFVAVALGTIVDVLLRWLLNSPIDGVEEVSKLAVAIAIASFFPLAIAERHHVSIGFLGALLGRRATAWLEAFAALVAAGFFVAVAWQLAVYTLEVEAAGETTWILAWPVAPWWAAASLFMAVCVPVQVAAFAAALGRALRGGRES